MFFHRSRIDICLWLFRFLLKLVFNDTCIFSQFFSSQEKNLSILFFQYIIGWNINYDYYSFESLSNHCLPVVFSLDFDSKSPQISRTLHTILADLNNGVVLDGLPQSLLFPSPPVPRISRFLTVPRAPITIGITVTFHVPQFFSIA